MKNKHTPAPWEAHGFEIWAYGERIADTITGVNFDEDRANARLMAAAPDLLKALQAFKKASLGEDFDGWHEKYDEAVSLARAALAKATGEKHE
jgi:hypothetical protein